MPAFQLTRPIRLTLTGSATANADFTAGTSVPVANAFTLSGLTTGITGTPTIFTVTPNGQMATDVVVTPAATNSGSVSPSTLTFISGTSAARTFTVTRAADGTSSVSITNNGGLSNIGTPISHTTTAIGASTLATSFTLTSASTQTLAPFTIGIAIAKGELPSGNGVTTNLSSYQSIITRRWNDGSAKHVVISGRSNTSTTPLTVTVEGGTAPTGTDLTSTDIASAAPTASIQCGAFGTVTLSSLLASPYRTWYSGPQMVECHYRADVGGGTDLSAWFHVRLYLGGRIWIRAIVENGYLDNGSGAVGQRITRSYVPTIIIGGTTVYSNGGATLNHYANTRYKADGWIGSDPQVTATHDVAYLRSTKLVPNYGWTSPSAAALSALGQTYTPMSVGSWTPTMGNTGYQAQIGLLPLWDAMYCTSGDSRALNAVLAQASHLNSYAVVWRAKSTQQSATIATNNIVHPSSFSSWNIDGPNTGGTDTTSAGSLTWEVNHHGSGGYLAYILTGDAWHYETMALQASMCYLTKNYGDGLGTSRIMSRQVRGTAWSNRTVGQYTAIARTSDLSSGPAGGYNSLLENNYSYWAAVTTSGTSFAWSGIVYTAMWSWGPGEQASWMHDFWIATNGMLYDIDALSTTTNLITVRDWMYKYIVGRFGTTTSSTDYPFISAARYTHRVAVANDSGYYQNWGAIYTGTTGLTNNSGSNTLGSDGQASILADAPTSYWGNALPALSYAVDHGATGASTAYNRLTGATNWSMIRDSGFDNTPLWGTKPRIATTLPAWVTAASLWQWVDVPTSNLSSVVPSPVPPGAPAAKIYAWNGATLRRSGSHLILGAAGGHNDYAGNEVNSIQLNSETPTWVQKTTPTVASLCYNNATQFYGDYKPACTHTYYSTQYSDALDKMFIMPSPGLGDSIGVSAPGGWGYFGTNYPFVYTWDSTWLDPRSVGYPAQYTGGGDFTSALAAKHQTTEDIYYWRSGSSGLYKFVPSTGVWTNLGGGGGNGYAGGAIDPIRNRLLVIGNYDQNIQPKYVSLTNGANLGITFTGQTASLLTIGPQVCYDEGNDNFLVFINSGDSVTIRRINCTTHVVDTPSTTGTPPSRDPANSNGFRGAIHYVPELGGFVAMTTYSGNMKFLKTKIV